MLEVGESFEIEDPMVAVFVQPLKEFHRENPGFVESGLCDIVQWHQPESQTFNSFLAKSLDRKLGDCFFRADGRADRTTFDRRRIADDASAPEQMGSNRTNATM